MTWETLEFDPSTQQTYILLNKIILQIVFYINFDYRYYKNIKESVMKCYQFNLSGKL